MTMPTLTAATAPNRIAGQLLAAEQPFTACFRAMNDPVMEAVRSRCQPRSRRTEPDCPL
jgi:hypothetical protein